jgi:tetratricopeptide (TPR) repeat protein
MKPTSGDRSESDAHGPQGSTASAPALAGASSLGVSADAWGDGLAEDGLLQDDLPQGGKETLGECELLQYDLSQMVDGELQEEPAARTLERLEALPDCRDFFENIVAQVSAHRDVADPEQLVERYRELTGGRIPGDLETRQLVHRLASIFYQVGKAYALSAFDPDWRQRVFERAVSVEAARSQGRGFIDGIAARQSSEEGARFGQIEWHKKRHLLNGLLERIERPADKAKRMLEECLKVEPDYDPAHLYLGFLDQKAGLRLRAAKRFRYVFDEAVDPGNRGHAAMQLGKLYVAEGEFRTALTWFRWVGISGLAHLDERFFPAMFNIGLCYVHLGRGERALATFRQMLDRHPGRRTDLANFFARSPKLRSAIDAQPDLGAAFLARCPELFVRPESSPNSGGDNPASNQGPASNSGRS